MTSTTVASQDAQRPLFLGVDVGGTSIKIGLVDDAGRVLAQTKIDTHEERGAEDAMQRTRGAASEMLNSLGLSLADVAAVGMGTPGTMDIHRGMMLEPHNLPHWYNAPVRDLLSKALDGMPVSFANDANAAAFGESWVGSGAKYHSIVMLTLGTGVGGGIIIGDLSVDGENSAGSELGHIIVDSSPAARVCGCGRPGHLEAYCSATALVKVAEEFLASGRVSSLRDRILKGERLTALMIGEEAEIDDDPLANEMIDDLAHWLAIGIVSVMHCIDPGAVIIGGAMDFGGERSPVGRRFLENIRYFVRRRVFPVMAKRTIIEFASLGGDAGFIGAAGIARADEKRRKAKGG